MSQWKNGSKSAWQPSARFTMEVGRIRTPVRDGGDQHENGRPVRRVSRCWRFLFVSATLVLVLRREPRWYLLGVNRVQAPDATSRQVSRNAARLQ